MAYNGSVTISGASGALVGVSDNAYASANLIMFHNLMATYASSGFSLLSGSTNLLVANGFGPVGVIDNASSSTIIVGDSSNLSFFGGSGNATLVTGTGNTLVFAGSGNDTIALGGGTDQVYLGSGNSQVSVAGADNVIQAGSGSTAITLTGIGATVDGGFGLGTSIAPLLVDDTAGTSSTINVINGTTIDASQISTTTVNAYGDTTVNGGANSTTLYNQINGTLYFIGNDAKLLVDGGPAAGNDTLYGASNSVIVLDNQAHNNVLVGNDATKGDGGAVLFDGASAGGGNQFWAGSGNTTLIGGTGGDTLVGGTGETTMIGGIGSSASYFDLFMAGTGSATNLTIGNFSAVASNQLTLFNFGSSAAATAIAGATSDSSGTTLRLANGATITLVDVQKSSLTTTNVVSTT